MFHIFVSKLTLANWLNKTLVGQPTIVIKHGKIIKSNLKYSRFTLAELLSSIREKGYPDVAFIDYAIIEPSGDVSVLPNQVIAPVTPRQLKIETAYQGLPIAVIIDGELQPQNLKLTGKDESWLTEELHKAGHPDQKSIFYAAVRDNEGLLTVDTGEGHFQKN